MTKERERMGSYNEEQSKGGCCYCNVYGGLRLQGWSLWLQALMSISRFAARKSGEGKEMECSKCLYQNQRQRLSSLLSLLITSLFLLGEG